VFIHAHGTALALRQLGQVHARAPQSYEYTVYNPFCRNCASAREHAVPSQPTLCHCRQVYLPMAHLYGMRQRMPADELTHALGVSSTIGPMRASASRAPQHIAQVCLHATRRRWGGQLFSRASTNACICRRFASVLSHGSLITSSSRTAPPNSFASAGHACSTPCALFQSRKRGDGAQLRRLEATCGMARWYQDERLQLDRLWDTAFAAQAMLETPLWSRHGDALQRATLLSSTIRSLKICRSTSVHRHPSRGGGLFRFARTAAHHRLHRRGSDRAMMLEDAGCRTSEERILDPVSLLLGWQNRDGVATSKDSAADAGSSA